jgi:hypothetical protein
MSALGVGPFLVASNTILTCSCPCAVIAEQSTPAFCSTSPNSSPSSLNVSTAELMINVGGCFFACSDVMCCDEANSDSRSCGNGIYISMAWRTNGTVLNGPLKNWNSLSVLRSLVTVSVTGEIRTWNEMGMVGVRVDERIVTATVSCPIWQHQRFHPQSELVRLTSSTISHDGELAA